MAEFAVEADAGRLNLAERADALRVLTSALVSSMPRERRAVLALAIVQKLSYRDIALRLGIGEDAAKLHLRDGLAVMHRAVVMQAAPRLPQEPSG